jgi:hypothetical protein
MNFDLQVELNHMRHAELLAEAKQARLIRQLKKEQPKNWKQVLAVGICALALLIPAQGGYGGSEPSTVADKASPKLFLASNKASPKLMKYPDKIKPELPVRVV